MKSNKQPAKSNKQHENSKKQRAKSNEQRAKSNEQQAKTSEQQAIINKQQASSKYSYFETNVHRMLSVLNLTIIFIKPFTCNNTVFILFRLNIISPLNVFFEHLFTGIEKLMDH